VSEHWLNRALLVLGLWLAVAVVAHIFGAHPSYGLLVLVLAAGAGTLMLLLDTSARAEGPVWTLPDENPVRPPGEDPHFAMLRRVVDGHLDARAVDDQLHRHLLAVVDERLLASHGVSRVADPARAERLMGPELTAFAHATDPYPRLDTARIAVLIDRIEAL